MKLKPGDRHDKEIFRTIFVENWDNFKDEKPVQKMLNFSKESGGYCEYVCMKCGRDLRRVCFSCKSCFCLSCSKVYADNMVSQVRKILHPGVIYQHCILTIPKQLRQVFYDNRHEGELFSRFMHSGYECLENVVSTVKGRLDPVVSLAAGRSGKVRPSYSRFLPYGQPC